MKFYGGMTALVALVVFLFMLSMTTCTAIRNLKESDSPTVVLPEETLIVDATADYDAGVSLQCTNNQGVDAISPVDAGVSDAAVDAWQDPDAWTEMW